MCADRHVGGCTSSSTHPVDDRPTEESAEPPGSGDRHDWSVRRPLGRLARGIGPLRGAAVTTVMITGLALWLESAELHRRNPMSLFRLPGALRLRFEDRTLRGSLLKLPPRIDRLEPDAGPPARRRPTSSPVPTYGPPRAAT